MGEACPEVIIISNEHCDGRNLAEGNNIARLAPPDSSVIEMDRWLITPSLRLILKTKQKKISYILIL